MTQHPGTTVLAALAGAYVCKAVQVATKYEIADRIGEEVVHVTELAQACRLNEDALYRTLRLLSSYEIFREVEPFRFANTPASQLLRDGAPGSLKDFATAWNDDWHWAMMGSLDRSVATGHHHFPEVLGQENVWKYFQSHPQAGALFGRAMTSLSDACNPPIAASYDFSKFQTVADIGASYGALLSTILTHYPHLQGILFDLPFIAAEAPKYVPQEIANRIYFCGGDFHQGVPVKADIYCLKYIVHDWSDEQAGHILSNIREVMPSNGRVLVIEQIVPEDNRPDFAKALDVEMFNVQAGKERTAHEFHRLLKQSGFDMHNIIPTPSPLSIIEARPL